MGDYAQALRALDAAAALTGGVAAGGVGAAARGVAPRGPGRPHGGLGAAPLFPRTGDNNMTAFVRERTTYPAPGSPDSPIEVAAQYGNFIGGALVPPIDRLLSRNRPPGTGKLS